MPQLSPQQEKFFANSKVRDQQGNLLICYHGSKYKFNSFDSSKVSFGNSLGWGYYFSSSEETSKQYADQKDQVGQYFLNLTNPYLYTKTSIKQEFLLTIAKQFGITFEQLKQQNTNLNNFVTKLLIEKGYDGVIATDPRDGVLEIVAYYPNQIKTVLNQNPTNSDNINEANELERRAKAHKKKQKGRGWWVNPNAGNVEFNNAFFNHATGADGGTWGSCASGEQGAAMGESLEEKLTHEQLNPLFWDEDGYLHLDVADKIEEIVQAFLEDLEENEIPIDYVDTHIVGSNASYNYTPYSDLDVHIVADLDKASCQKDKSILQLLYNFFRSHFNDKYDITIHGVPVELYIEDVDVETKSAGVYSMAQGEWIKKPSYEDIPEPDISDRVSEWEQEYENVLAGETDLDTFLNNIYLLRKHSIASEGEYGPGNLLFKDFRNKGHLDKIKDLIAREKSQQLSLEQLGEDLQFNESINSEIDRVVKDFTQNIEEGIEDGEFEISSKTKDSDKFWDGLRRACREAGFSFDIEEKQKIPNTDTWYYYVYLYKLYREARECHESMTSLEAIRLLRLRNKEN